MIADTKNIIYIGGFELPDKDAAAIRVLSNGKILNRLGYTVSYIGLKKDQSTKSDEVLIQESGTFKVWHLNYPNTVVDWFFYIVRISNILRIITKNFSKPPIAIIAYNYPAISFIRLKSYCKKKKIKLIGDCTEWYIAAGGIFYRLIKKIDTSLRMRLIQKELDGLIVISSFLYEYYKPYVKNLILLPPLIDKNEDSFIIDRNSADKIRTLVYAGNPFYGRNGIKDRIDKIILALSYIKLLYRYPVKLIVIGISQKEFIQTFSRQAIPENVEDEIEFLGILPHHEVLHIINKADFTFFLRKRDRVTMAGFPTKFVESIRCGTPVLTNESSDIKNYLKNGELGFLVDETSPKTLADSIFKAISQPDDKIIEMKKRCLDARIFDFREYQNNFKAFINDVTQH